MANSLDAPPGLRQLQERMAARIFGQLGWTPIDAWLCVPRSAQVAGRLGVYREGYPARVAEALAETYPAVAHLLGDREFAALAHRYSAAVPLAAYNLNDAGAALGEFLRRDPIANAHPYLPDLAALEWRVATAFHAFDGDPLDPRALPWTAADWAGAVLMFQPSVSLMGSIWPLVELWGARHAPGMSADVATGREQYVVVRRNGFTVRCESVSVHEANALRLLLDGRCLSDVVEAAAAAGVDASAVSEWFSRWTAGGMLAAAKLMEPESPRSARPRRLKPRPCGRIVRSQTTRRSEPATAEEDR